MESIELITSNLYQNAKRGSTSETADASFLKDGGDLLSRIAAQYHRRAWA